MKFEQPQTETKKNPKKEEKQEQQLVGTPYGIYTKEAAEMIVEKTKEISMLDVASYLKLNGHGDIIKDLNVENPQREKIEEMLRLVEGEYDEAKSSVKAYEESKKLEEETGMKDTTRESKAMFAAKAEDKINPLNIFRFYLRKRLDETRGEIRE